MVKKVYFELVNLGYKDRKDQGKWGFNYRVVEDACSGKINGTPDTAVKTLLSKLPEGVDEVVVVLDDRSGYHIGTDNVEEIADKVRERTGISTRWED